MSTPLLLDLFCGAGGAGMGYARAGFEVVGVDLDPKPLRHNPHEHYVGDALAVLDTLLAGETWQGYRLGDFAAIHASPPCQDYSTANTWGRPGRTRKAHPRLINPTCDRLIQSGCVWVIENVRLAIDEMLHPMIICGTSLGLRVQRHRLFDSNVMLFSPGACAHRAGDISVRTTRIEYLSTPHGPPIVNGRGETCFRNSACPFVEAKKAMGIDWMNRHDLGEAIPPAYTHWIGQQLMTVIEVAA